MEQYFKQTQKYKPNNQIELIIQDYIDLVQSQQDVKIHRLSSDQNVSNRL